MALLRSIATVGGFTLLSRVVGFVRDILIAAVLGAGTVADAFFVAFKFPNLFRRLFAEGAFNAAFVPLFSGTLEAEGKDRAKVFAREAFSTLALILAILVAVMEIIMPWAMIVFAPGFADVPGKTELAVELSRITFPYLLFISLVSLLSGVLNSMGKFAAAAGTPVLLNLVLILALLGLTPFTPTAGHALAMGVAVAGVAQFVWLMIACAKEGIDLSLVRPRLTPEVKTLLRRIVPGAVGAGVYQINLLVDTILASLVADGAVSYLYYADRVNQLPLGVVGVAVGTALLPLLSRQLKAGDDGAALHSQNRALEFALFLTLPSAFALMVLSDPIIAVLFERGAFGAEQAAATAKALAAFALGLPAYVLIKVFTPGFFARGDTKTPVQVAIIALLANIAFNLVLMGPLGHMGIALSTSLSAWLNAMTLAWLLKRQGRFSLDPRLKTRLPRILLACGLMTTALYGGLVLGSDWLSAGPLLARGGVLSGLIGLGLGTYLLSAQLFGAVALGEVKKLVRRRS